MAPRISVIACLSSFGEVHLSLTQSNTNDNIMEIYLVQLAKKLDREKPGWRNTYVIFLDGAVSDSIVCFSIDNDFFPLVLPPELFHSESDGDAAAADLTGGAARLQRQPHRTVLLAPEADEPQRGQTDTWQKRLLKCRPDRPESGQAAGQARPDTPFPPLPAEGLRVPGLQAFVSRRS